MMPRTEKKYLVASAIRMTEEQADALENLRKNGYNASSLVRLWIQEGLEKLKQKRGLKNLRDLDAI